MIALDRRYLDDRSEAPAFCHACGQPIARAAGLLLTDAIADYRLELGDARASGEAIAARLKHVVDHLVATDRIDLTCADACLPAFADRFREWSRREPVRRRNGEGVVTVERPRAPATTEASLGQLAAVLNHAANQRRSDARPHWKPLGAKNVNQRRRTRVEETVLADMLRYAAEPLKQRNALHAFLVASLCTMARPGAIVEISTDPARRQWQPRSPVIDLNQAGRVQNKKFRPTLPVLPPLAAWLQQTLADTAAEKIAHRTGGWLVNYFGRPVRNVDTAWLKMLVELGLPTDREWRPYVLRHSLATIVRGAGVPRWELEGWLGHNSGSTTETYAVEHLFPNVTAALQQLLDDLNFRAPGALHRNRTGEPTNIVPIGGRQMPSG